MLARRYEYMIENILMLLKATLADESVDAEALIEQCHPLGLFKASTMKTIVAFNNSPSGYMDLYSTVLVDTPVGTCMCMCCTAV
jgi:V-type H+-transporting ATPase subunit d